MNKIKNTVAGVGIVIGVFAIFILMKSGFLAKSYPDNLDAIRIGIGILCTLKAFDLGVKGLLLIGKEDSDY